MKLNFCTLFNSNYLTRGLLLYESLSKNCSNFHLYVFAFDDATFKFLNESALKDLTVISLREFEDAELLKVKPGRSAGEYCWTCTSSTIVYSIEKFKLDHCTYIDADMYFFSDPKILIDEMGDKSVFITEHRYSPAYDRSKESGKYCVQFVTFKNDSCGMEVLRWWRNACIEWCYNRIEDGKFGDQKYLDDWTTKFSCIHVMKHCGGGIAPWNVQQYSFEKFQDNISGTEILTGDKFDVIFFHFHGLKFYSNDMVELSGEVYELNTNVRSIFYFPYITALNRTKDKIAKQISFNPHGSAGKSKFGPFNLLMKLKYYINDLKFSLWNLSGKNLPYRKLHHHFYRTDEF
jgi:hypothetical protein